MKICKYVKCNVMHDKRGDYCKPSHKTRQWELNKGKPNAIESVVKPKSVADIDISHAVYDMLKGSRSKAVVGSDVVGYRNEYQTVPRKPTFYMTQGFGVISSISNLKKHDSPKKVLAPIGKSLLWGFGLDLIWNMVQGDTKLILKRIPIIEERRAAVVSRTAKTNDVGTRGSAVQYRQKEIPTITFNREYTSLLGRPPEDFFMLVHGQSGHGKSYWTIAFAEYFQRNMGKVIYYAAEQRGYNKALQNMMNEIQSTFVVEREPRKLSIEQMMEDSKEYDLMIFDSFNEMDLQPDDIKRIRQSGNAAIVGILQSTKDGQFKGDNTWLHDTDIMVQLVNRVANSSAKSRYDSQDSKVINL